MQNTYLIIGGAGFIGSNAAEYFLNQGHRVIIFDNFSRSGCVANSEWLKSLASGGSLEIVKCDVIDVNQEVLKNLVEKADFVLHLAAQVAVTTSVIDPRADFLTNAFGTFNVLEAVRLSKKRPGLIYASTNKVYGGLENLAVIENDTRYVFRDVPSVSETQPLDFHSPYGCSKGAADQYVRDYSRIFGLKTAVCRQSCIYGTRQFGVEDQGWVAWFIIAVQTGKKITVYGNGKQVRDLLFVTDLVRLYDTICNNFDRVSGSIFNVGGGENNTLSLLEFLDILSKKMGRPIQYTAGDIRPGDQPIYISDNSLAKSKLDWVPKVDVNHGIEKLWVWVKNNPSLFV